MNGMEREEKGKEKNTMPWGSSVIWASARVSKAQLQIARANNNDAEEFAEVVTKLTYISICNSFRWKLN